MHSSYFYYYRPSGFSIRIRGASGFDAETEPLFIIDGVAGADPTTVAPEDIESFKELSGKYWGRDLFFQPSDDLQLPESPFVTRLDSESLGKTPDGLVILF